MHEPRGRLLLADDNRVNRLLLARQLTQLGHDVEAVDSGTRALELLAEHRFDLLLLDIEMPGVDGFEVLRRIAVDSKLRDVPVIVTSALEGLDNVVRCIELGAEDYLSKPVNPVLLKARIGASLEKKKLRDQQRDMVNRFATRQVAEDLATSGFALGGRRVNASVLFCDIRGFTTIAETQGAEETIELLNTWYALMFDAVADHGGVVTQIMGDGLMAIFGAPQPVAEPARRAVAAARDMIAMVEQFSAEQQAAGRPPIRIGVGIATGPMVAGYAGTQARATYTCVGDTVNLAARLESYTKDAKQALLVDAETRAALRGEPGIEALGQVVFKGKTIPMEVFAVR